MYSQDLHNKESSSLDSLVASNLSCKSSFRDKSLGKGEAILSARLSADLLDTHCWKHTEKRLCVALTVERIQSVTRKLVQADWSEKKFAHIAHAKDPNQSKKKHNNNNNTKSHCHTFAAENEINHYDKLFRASTNATIELCFGFFIVVVVTRCCCCCCCCCCCPATYL